MGRVMLSWFMTAFLLLLVLSLHASSSRAQMQYDLDGDCDVDGSDVCLFLSSENDPFDNDLNGFLLEFGKAEECCAPVGVGTPIDGYPNWQERTMIVFTNMVRMAPVDYRDTYMIHLGFQA